VLRGYYDDSGTDQQSAFCVVGGYLSTVDSWNLFAQEWLEVLEADPKIKYSKNAGS
jgi:hypothetical protein